MERFFRYFRFFGARQMRVYSLFTQKTIVLSSRLLFFAKEIRQSETDIMDTKLQIKSDKFTPFGGIFCH